jgi:hypothetical protein
MDTQRTPCPDCGAITTAVVESTFWVPAHVRGRASQGVVVSDYRVDAPKVAP